TDRRLAPVRASRLDRARPVPAHRIALGKQALRWLIAGQQTLNLGSYVGNTQSSVAANRRSARQQRRGPARVYYGWQTLSNTTGPGQMETSKRNRLRDNYLQLVRIDREGTFL